MTFEYIRDQMHHVFYETPWYGEGIMTKLKSLPAEIANENIAIIGYTVGRYLRHMLAWREYALGYLRGEDVPEIPLDSPHDWPEGKESLAQLLLQLEESQETLLDELSKALPESFKTKYHPESPYTLGELMQGVIYHDIYHLGQIALLIRLREEQ